AVFARPAALRLAPEIAELAAPARSTIARLADIEFAQDRQVILGSLQSVAASRRTRYRKQFAHGEQADRLGELRVAILGVGARGTEVDVGDGLRGNWQVE